MRPLSGRCATASVGTELAVDVGAVCVREVLGSLYLALWLLLNVVASHLHLVLLHAMLLISELLPLGHLPGGLHPLLLAYSELLLLMIVLLLLLLLLVILLLSCILTLILLAILLIIIDVFVMT